MCCIVRRCRHRVGTWDSGQGGCLTNFCSCSCIVFFVFIDRRRYNGKCVIMPVGNILAQVWSFKSFCFHYCLVSD